MSDDIQLKIGAELVDLKKDIKKAEALIKKSEENRKKAAKRQAIQTAKLKERISQRNAKNIHNFQIAQIRKTDAMERRLSRKRARNRLRATKARIRKENALERAAIRKRAAMGRGLRRGIGFGIAGIAGIGGFSIISAAREILDFDVALASLASQAKITRKEQFRLRESMTDTAVATGVQRDVILTAISRIYEKSGEYKFAADNVEKLAKVIRGTQVDPMAIGETLAAMAFGFKGVKWDGKNVPIFDLLEILIAQGDEASVTIRDLASNGEELMGAFNVAGLNSLKSFKEFFALVQVAGGGGTSSEAATFVKNFIIQITKRGAKIEEMLGDKLKDRILKPGGGIRNVQGVVKDILQATGGDVEEILKLVPRFRGAMPLTLMAGEFFREGTTKKFDHLIKLGDAMGTIERRYKRIAETPSQGFERLIALITKLSDVALVDTLEYTSDEIQNLVDDPGKIREYAEAFKEIGNAILLVAKAIGLVAKVGDWAETALSLGGLGAFGEINPASMMKIHRKVEEIKKRFNPEQKKGGGIGNVVETLSSGLGATGPGAIASGLLKGLNMIVNTNIVLDKSGNVKKENTMIEFASQTNTARGKYR